MTVAIGLYSSSATSWVQAGWRIRRNWKVRVGLFLMAALVVLAMAQPILKTTLWSSNPTVYHPEIGFDPLITHPSGPSASHLLGTDPLGRDVLSQLTVAIRPSLVVAASVAVVVAVTSMIAGVATAYFGNRVDAFLTQLAGLLVLLPAPIMFLVVGKGRPEFSVLELGLVYGLFFGLGPATLVIRSRALSVVQKPFVEAARAAGGSSPHIIWHHLAPHLLPHVASQVLIGVTGAMIAEGFIELLGAAETRLGLGSLVYLALTYQKALTTAIPWSTLLVGAGTISLLGACFYLVGVGIEESVDPRGAVREGQTWYQP